MKAPQAGQAGQHQRHQPQDQQHQRGRPRARRAGRAFTCRLVGRGDTADHALAALAAWRRQAAGRAFVVQQATAGVLTVRVTIDAADRHARLGLDASASVRRVQAVFEGWC